MKKMSSIALCGKDLILTSSSPISISSSSYSSSLSSSSSSVPTNTSQFGFVPPSGQPDLQSRTGPRVRGSAEKAAHQGQVLSGLPHECHGPGAGKGSCNAKKEKKHKTHLVIVSHPRDAFLDRRPSASKALLLQN